MTKIMTTSFPCPPDATVRETDRPGNFYDVPLFGRVVEAAQTYGVSATFHNGQCVVEGEENAMLGFKMAIQVPMEVVPKE